MTNLNTPHAFVPVDEIPDPEPRGVKGGLYLPLFDYCRANPGQWVKMESRMNPGTASNITKGLLVGCERGEFEAVARDTKAGKCDIYVRFPEQTPETYTLPVESNSGPADPQEVTR